MQAKVHFESEHICNKSKFLFMIYKYAGKTTSKAGMVFQ